MDTIKSRCEACGEVVIPASAVELQWCSHAPASYYTFDCPECRQTIRRHADGRVAQLLIVAGVRPLLWHLPAEALEPKTGPTLTIDDVIDMHSELERPDWFARLAATIQRSGSAA